MIKYLTALFVTIYPLANYAQSNTDSADIIALLEKEAATWRSGDAKVHADCWVIRPYSRILISTTEAKVIDLDPNFMLNPPSNMLGNGGRAILTNHKIGITGNSAWVSHDEESISKEGKSTYSYEVRLLEKINGAWKLVGQSVHQYRK